MKALLRSMRSSLAAPLVLVLAIALVVGVPTLVLGEVAANDTRARVRQAQLSAEGSAAERVATSITRTFAAIRYSLGYAARPARGMISPLAAAAERGDAAAIQAELIALHPVFPEEIVTLALYDVGGSFRAAAGLGITGDRAGGTVRRSGGSVGAIAVRADALPISADRAEGPQLPTEVREALTRSRAAIVLDPLDPARTAKGRIMSIGIAVTGSDLRTPAGYLLITTDLNFLAAAVLEGGDAGSEVYVLDGEGRLLLRRSKAATDSELGRDLTSSMVMTELLAGRRVNGEAADLLGQGAQLVATRRIQPLIDVTGALELDLGWQVIVARPLALVYADVETALAQFRVVRLALLGLLLAGAFVLGISLQQIRRQRRQLEIAGRHKSEFLANMSHELRTPLNAVIGFSDVLLQRIAGPISDKQAEYLGDIRASGRHLLALINDLLDLSKIEAGRMELQLGAFSLPATLADALTMVRERAGERQVALDLDIAANVDVITADERKVRQVVANLLSNAVKFTPDGGTVAVHAARQGGEVRVAVQDTGVGIAVEDQARIFEEFEQAKDGREAAEGTGLGLTLTRRIVELHGGRIWVESEVGRGSTFTFALPLLPAGKEG